MKRHTLVISDIHLCEIEPGTGAWMRYRQREQAPDTAIASMLDQALAAIDRAAANDGDGAPHELTLALNGDIFDFDAPRVINGESVFHDEPRDEAHSVPFIEAVLRDHPIFVAAVAKVVAAGHKIVLISGNHDAQMTLPGVRDAIRRAILDAAAAISSEPREALSARILFRAWFYITEDGVLLEHGGQYDPYCVFHYPTAPYHKDTHRVQPTLGSLATRLMTSRMGYFNPHVDSTYELSGPGYFAHWFEHYINSKHSLLFAWLGGALSSFFRLVAARDPGSAERRRRAFAEASAETGVPEAKLLEHAALFASPVELLEPVRAARELWVDRLTLTTSSALWAAGFLIFAPPPWMLAALVFVLLFAIYEAVTPKLRVRDRWAGVDSRAPDIAKVHGARAVVFGHTHHPHGYWNEGVFIGNSGSWSASFHDIECKQPVFPDRPVIWLTADGDRLTGGLVLWTGKSFEPREAKPSHEPSFPG